MVEVNHNFMKKQFLGVEGISEYLTMSKSCIYKKVAAREMPNYNIGIKIFITRRTSKQLLVKYFY